MYLCKVIILILLTQLHIMIEYENMVCKELGIPAIPKKEWDGERSFKVGVAVINLCTEGRQVYGVATFNSDVDKVPRVTKVFTLEPFVGIDKVFVVPDYMDTSIETMDLDDESKKAAQMLIDEANELENDGVKKEELPANEYFFDHITNDEEAAAFIKDYNSRNKIKGRVPKTHDGLVMRLSVIYSETNKKSKK